MTIFDTKDITKDILELKKAGKKISSTKSDGFMDEQLAKEVIAKVAELKYSGQKDKIAQAMILIAKLGQDGASNANIGTLKVTDNHDVSLTNIELKTIVNEKKKGATMRQFYKTIRDDVAQVAKLLNFPGDLAKQMQAEDSNVTAEELIWCSNFQTKNKNAPAKINDWLCKNAKEHFQKNPKP